MLQLVELGRYGNATVQSNCFGSITVNNHDTSEFPSWTNLVKNTQ